MLTVDQVASRSSPDLLEQTLHNLATVSTRLPFVRTIGDEFQGLVDDPLSVLTAMLTLMRAQAWHIGLGIGDAEQPLPADVRAARGPAFVHAREAVERAKREPSHLAVVASASRRREAADAEGVLRLVAAVRTRRTPSGWEVADLADTGLTQAEIGARLGVSRQAVGQRLHAALWAEERAALPAAATLLSLVDGKAAG